MDIVYRLRCFFRGHDFMPLYLHTFDDDPAAKWLVDSDYKGADEIIIVQPSTTEIVNYRCRWCLQLDEGTTIKVGA